MVTKMMALNESGRLDGVKLVRDTLNKRQETDLVRSMMLAQGEYYVGNMDGAGFVSGIGV